MNTTPMKTIPHQFRVERDLAFGPDTIHLYLYGRLPDGRVAIPESTITMRVIERDAAPGHHQPILTTNHEAIQSLMDELWHLGIRPTEGHGSTGQLAATEKHLDHITQLLDKTLLTTLNVVNAGVLAQHAQATAPAAS